MGAMWESARSLHSIEGFEENGSGLYQQVPMWEIARSLHRQGFEKNGSGLRQQPVW